MKAKNNSIVKRQEKEKAIILEQLKKTPIIQVACERAGIARASFYRWRKENKEFNESVETSIEQGLHLINDMAETQLLSAIKDKNISAIMFWLRSHHNAYKAKIEVTAKNEEIVLTPEQEENIKRALSLASLTDGDLTKEKTINNERNHNESKSIEHQ